MANVKIINRKFVSSSASNFTTSITEQVLYEGEDLLQIITSTQYPMEGSRLAGNSAFILTSREISEVGNTLVTSGGGRGCQAMATFTYTLSTEVKRKYAEAPWEIGAQNVSISFSTASLPLTHGFSIKGKELPVVNSAGSPIACDGTEYIKELHFTYCQQAKSGNRGFPKIAEEPSRNSSGYTIAGCYIKAKCGKILPQSARYICEYNADGSIYREYWEIDTTIMIRERKEGWSLELLDVGTVAKTDDSNGKPVALWRWFAWTKSSKSGDVKFGSFQQACSARAEYAESIGEVGTNDYTTAFNEFPIEEITEPFPLKDGRANIAAMGGGNYETIEVCDCDALSWSSFSMPLERA